MALADIQRILTQILTSPAIRARLRSEAESLTEAEGPRQEAIYAVMTISPRQLGHYAEALVNKRCRAVGKCHRQPCKSSGPTVSVSGFGFTQPRPGPRVQHVIVMMRLPSPRRSAEPRGQTGSTGS